MLEPGYREAEYNPGGCGSCLILILLTVSHYMNYGSLWWPPTHSDRVEKMKHVDTVYILCSSSPLKLKTQYSPMMAQLMFSPWVEYTEQIVPF